MSCLRGFSICVRREKKPQVPPLRFAPVGMTILLCPQELQREILDPAIELSSRPERSVVEGPAVSFPVLTQIAFQRSLHA
jgi:hypothetical protein